jgi:prepilin-type N-terminal cleavage/methylation domain-containing protein
VKRAFTLIELLVVIAIIAILAAILFPVFAQAKSAAKGTASLSNDKQQTLAVLMYTNDTDDTAVLDEAWGGGYPVWYGIANSDFAPWDYLISPYMKNAQIVQDPLGTSASATPAGWPSDLWNLYSNLDYGYDYEVFSPGLYGNNDAHGNMIRTPISMTTPNRIADTVLLTQHMNASEPGDNYWYGQGTVESFIVSDAPICVQSQQLCFVTWGLGSWVEGLGGTYVSGAETGFNAPRRADHLVTTFADGHAKAESTNSLAVGTNYSPTINQSAVVMTNINVYHWTKQ